MKRTPVMAVCLLAACHANAENEYAGWQIGAAATTTQFERDDKLVDDTSIGFKLFGQYRMNSWYGIEGAYYNSNDLSSNPTTSGTSDVEQLYKGFTIHGIGYIPVPMEEIDVFLKLGFYDFSIDLAVDGQSISSGSDDGLAIGVGTSGKIMEQLKFRAEFDWYNTEAADLWTVSLGLAYHF